MSVLPEGAVKVLLVLVVLFVISVVGAIMLAFSGLWWWVLLALLPAAIISAIYILIRT